LKNQQSHASSRVKLRNTYTYVGHYNCGCVGYFRVKLVGGHPATTQVDLEEVAHDECGKPECDARQQVVYLEQREREK
jgi:hypothetical protein